MFLADSKIKEFGKDVILPFEEKQVHGVAYDLVAEGFYTFEKDAKEVKEFTLQLGESIFVASKEVIALPDDLTAMVNIRNSRLRQGLSVESPIYSPGHKTRVFFRLSNLTGAEVKVKAGESYASLYFVPVEGKVDQPYSGSFADELTFRGMAGHTDKYKNDMSDMDII